MWKPCDCSWLATYAFCQRRIMTGKQLSEELSCLLIMCMCAYEFVNVIIMATHLVFNLTFSVLKWHTLKTWHRHLNDLQEVVDSLLVQHLEGKYIIPGIWQNIRGSCVWVKLCFFSFSLAWLGIFLTDSSSRQDNTFQEKLMWVITEHISIITWDH